MIKLRLKYLARDEQELQSFLDYLECRYTILDVHFASDQLITRRQYKLVFIEIEEKQIKENKY